MLKSVIDDKNPDICIITPLKPGDKVSRETKISVRRNDLKILWYSYESDNNVMMNYKIGFEELKKTKKIPDYIIKIDSDTLWNRHTLDRMYDSIKNSPGNIAYTYCSFEYKGTVNMKFPAIFFNPIRLRQANYISSNSMFKTKIIEEIELVTDEKYRRLLDYAYLLKLLNNDYIGKPSEGYFIAKSSAESVSSQSADDYKIKMKRIVDDFVIKPQLQNTKIPYTPVVDQT